MLPLSETILTIVCLFVASFTQGVTGFGFGLVAMSLLPLFSNPRQASVLVGIFSLASSVSVFLSVRSCFHWRDTVLPLVGMAAGVPFGVYALTILDEQMIRRLVAVVVLLACYQVAKPRIARPRPLNPFWGILAGAMGGVLGGAFGIGGPPVIAYASFQNWEGSRYKAMLCSYFSISNSYRVVLMAVAGLITKPVLTLGTIALPALFLGTYVGVRAFSRLSGEGFRKAVLATLIMLAVSLLAL